jgi:hypothetical protein
MRGLVVYWLSQSRKLSASVGSSQLSASWSAPLTRLDSSSDSATLRMVARRLPPVAEIAWNCPSIHQAERLAGRTPDSMSICAQTFSIGPPTCTARPPVAQR